VEYDLAASTMTRKQLEDFSIKAAKAMERLESENAKLRQDIDTAKKVDIDVITGWRRWMQTIDEERERWADMATRLSAENQDLKQKISSTEEESGELIRVIESIAEIALSESEDGTNAKGMRKGLKTIEKMASNVVRPYSEITGRSQEDDSRSESDLENEEAEDDEQSD